MDSRGLSLYALSSLFPDLPPAALSWRLHFTQVCSHSPPGGALLSNEVPLGAWTLQTVLCPGHSPQGPSSYRGTTILRRQQEASLLVVLCLHPGFSKAEDRNPLPAPGLTARANPQRSPACTPASGWGPLGSPETQELGHPAAPSPFHRHLHGISACFAQSLCLLLPAPSVELGQPPSREGGRVRLSRVPLPSG